MRCLTLTQPWASLVAIGAKKIETRSWRTAYRGLLLIHAAKGPGDLGWQQMNHLCRNEEPFRSVLKLDKHPADVLPLGAIVAVCRLVDCRIIGRELNGAATIAADDMITAVPIPGNELAFGDYSPGRYAWLLTDVRALPEPIPCKGALGLWQPDAATRAAIERQQTAVRV